ncbi:SGNH/GDSL hydrolase family protein [Sulfitobacter sp. TBRI5]|uniref:SGNH/GDSL hydrolase family protein n=1 Tax=Sulfitobacter sp. TBRI5 TaxID=2989732 RepID=UPI003D9ADA6C
MYIKSITAILALSLPTSVWASPITDAYTSFYTFGDSLSDDGKFLALDPPSLGGRFSKDLVWAERIEDQFIAAGRDTANLAIGGATAGDQTTPATPLSTFGGQIGAFQTALGFGAQSPGDKPLVSVSFGANDLFASFVPDDIEAAADAVANGIRSIAAISSHAFDDFLVVNLPDLGATPAYNFLIAAAGGSADDVAAASEAATTATNTFNTRLAKNIIDLKDEGLNIIEWDSNELVSDIIANPISFGIADTSTPCTVSIGAPLDPTFSNPSPNCVDLNLDPNLLLFVDGVHPNGVAHSLAAERAANAIAANLAPVPVPASLPMLLSVVAVAGFAARRRAKTA